MRRVASLDAFVADPDQTLEAAAKLMVELDAGILPVGEADQLVGMITDRDIAIRGVGRGLGPDAAIREVMTEDVKYCFEDDEIEDVALNMGEIQVRRLPVLNREKRLVGIISLGDLAVTLAPDAETVGDSLAAISRPSASVLI
jgi:CBS domain-containing protein